MAELMPFDPRLLLLRRAVVTMAAAVSSFLTLWYAGLPLELGVTPAILAVVLTLTFSRTEGKTTAQQSRGATALRFALIPVISVAATGVAALFHFVFPVGAALFVLGLTFAIWVRRFGPLATRLGTIMSLPLMAVLIVPVHLPAALPTWMAGLISVVAAIVAVAWAEVWQWMGMATRFLPRRDVDRAARLDAEADAGAEGLGSPAGRSETQGAPSKVSAARGTPTSGYATPAHDVPLGDASVPGIPPGGTSVRGTPPRTGQARRTRPSTRMAVQMAVALCAAFVVGVLVFPDHWAWVVLTAFIVCAGNRGRGDVVYKSILRVAGAIAGTVAVVVIADLIGPADGTVVTVAVFTILFAGLWLRDINYAFWAAAVTVILALMQNASGQSVLTSGPVLGERIVAIVVGALCGILASWLILPIRTSAVVRRRLADALAALSVAVHPDTEPRARLAAERRFESELVRVEQVARVVRVEHRFTRRFRHDAHQAELIDAVVALAPLARDFVERAIDDGTGTGAGAGDRIETIGRAQLGQLARSVGAARRALASTPRMPAGLTGRTPTGTTIGAASAPLPTPAGRTTSSASSALAPESAASSSAALASASSAASATAPSAAASSAASASASSAAPATVPASSAAPAASAASAAVLASSAASAASAASSASTPAPASSAASAASATASATGTTAALAAIADVRAGLQRPLVEA